MGNVTNGHKTSKLQEQYRGLVHLFIVCKILLYMICSLFQMIGSSPRRLVLIVTMVF